jgi:hypothetical protein
MPFSDRFEKEYTRDTYSEVSTRPDLTERLRDVPPQHRMAVAFDQEPFDPYWHPGKDAMDRWDQVEIENSVFAAHAQDASPERQADYEALQVFNQAQQTSQGSYGPDQERIMASAQEAQEHSARHLYDVMQRDPAFREQIPDHLQQKITEVREAQHAHELYMHERYPEEHARPEPLHVAQDRSDDLVVDDREPVLVHDVPEVRSERGREPIKLAPHRAQEEPLMHAHDRAEDTDLVIDDPEPAPPREGPSDPRAAHEDREQQGSQFAWSMQSIEEFLNKHVRVPRDPAEGRTFSDEGQSSRTAPTQDDLEAARLSDNCQDFGRRYLDILARNGHGLEYVAGKDWYEERQAARNEDQHQNRDPRDLDRDDNRDARYHLFR